MSISEKLRATNNKIEQNTAQYNLDRQTTTISALPLGNVNKYGFLTRKDILPERDLLEYAATLKRFEYSPLGKELKPPPSAASDSSSKRFESGCQLCAEVSSLQ